MAGTLSIPNVIGTQSGPTVAASLFDANWVAIRDYVNAREMTSGLLAARPAASVAGRLYLATDVGGGQAYLDSGAAWLPVGAAATEIPLDGARTLKVVPHQPAQGTWAHGATTYSAVASADFNLFDSVLTNGHIISDAAQFSAVNYMISTQANPTTIVYEYWDGAAWSALTVGTPPGWNTRGPSQMRFTVPGDWVVGGSGTGVPAGNYNIRLRNTVGAVTVVGRASLPNKVDITADEIIMSDSSGHKVRRGSVSLLATNVRLAGSAANGRDQAGAFSAASWVYLWAIDNAAAIAGLWSASATAPTLPTGYTFKTLLGAWRFDANSQLIPMWQRGGKARLHIPIVDGAGRATATDAATLTLTIPPEAIRALVMSNTSGAVGYWDIGSRPYTSTGAAVTVSGEGEIKQGNANIGIYTEIDVEVASTIWTAQAPANYDLATHGWTFPGNLT